MNRALLVNEELVFRFAKSARAAADLRKELALLPQLAKHVQLATPEPALHGWTRSGLPFLAYPLLRGRIFENDEWQALPAAADQRVAEQLAELMSELQSFPTHQAELAGACPTHLRAAYQADVQRFLTSKPVLTGTVDVELVRYVERRFHEYSSEAAQSTKDVLLHADLSPDHLLFDAARLELCGVIDFGDATLSDPAYEYIYLLEDMGAPLARTVMRARGESDIEQRLHLVGLYVTFDHVRCILSGVEQERADWVSDGIAALRNEFRGSGDRS